MTNTNFYKDFDFQLLNSDEFKEDAVREELINPILKQLGYKAYGHNRIVYSKTLAHPFVKIGSQKRQINIVPDYLFEINGKYSWVLDAKAPTENIVSGENIEQVFSYAIHPDINAEIFALCNGKEFAAFSRDKKEPLLFFQLSEIDKHWNEIENLLSPDKFVENRILKTIPKFKIGNVYYMIKSTIDSVIIANEGANFEQINDELIIKGLEFGFLDILSKEYKDLTPILMNEFNYEPKTLKFYSRS